MGHAPDGAGKTTAYLLPIIDRVYQLKSIKDDISANSPYVLIIAPTRESVEHLVDVAHTFALGMSYMLKFDFF